MYTYEGKLATNQSLSITTSKDPSQFVPSFFGKMLASQSYLTYAERTHILNLEETESNFLLILYLAKSF
jgi:hypothetical protein